MSFRSRVGALLLLGPALVCARPLIIAHRGASAEAPENTLAVHAAGLKLAVWTVNDAEQARRVAAVGVDAITTDKPEWIRRRLRSD